MTHKKFLSFNKKNILFTLHYSKEVLHKHIIKDFLTFLTPTNIHKIKNGLISSQSSITTKEIDIFNLE